MPVLKIYNLGEFIESDTEKNYNCMMEQVQSNYFILQEPFKFGAFFNTDT